MNLMNYFFPPHLIEIPKDNFF
uniref:Uncharacterized protein n=1 Tax=Rhizophora mucronata TaxID=61149 RepID=A0A2P2NPQ8_RHIMU